VTTALTLLLAVLLVAANAFFVAAEFALVKAKAVRIDGLAKDGKFGARLTASMVTHLEAYLACCQLGVTMASLGLGWVGEPTVATLLRPLFEPLGMPEQALQVTAFLVGFLAFSSFHIVLGEQVPKTLAIRQPEPVALWIAYPLQAAYLLFFPLNWALNEAARGILRLLGVKERPRQDVLTDTELADLVEVSAEHGGVEEKQAEYIGNLFRLGGLSVFDVMVHRTNMYSVDVDEPPAKVVDAVMSGPHTRVPIWDKDPENIVGTVHIKDAIRAVKAAGGDASKVDIRAIMAKPWFVPDTTSLNDQLSAFLKRKTHIALVVDEYGEVQGLVTLEDILEEIVGEIADEHEVTVHGVRPQPDGSINVDGSVPIRDLNRATGWELPDDQANTIAGLVIHEARIIPEPGQAFTFHGYRFQVLRKNKNRVTALRITPLNRVKPAPGPGAGPASASAPGATS
jgi:CBS domain containing-hemolysin-like protein